MVQWRRCITRLMLDGNGHSTTSSDFLFIPCAAVRCETMINTRKKNKSSDISIRVNRILKNRNRESLKC